MARNVPFPMLLEARAALEMQSLATRKGRENDGGLAYFGIAWSITYLPRIITAVCNVQIVQ